MSWVRWSNWTPCGLVQVGQMPARDVDFHIRKFGKEAEKILKKVPEVKFCYLKDVDVVRHELVRKIIKAYDEHLL